jgi:hypothetical protein
MMSFLCSFEPLHLFLQNLVYVCHVAALVLQFCRKGRQLVAENYHLALETLLLFIRSGKNLADFGQLTLLMLDGSLSAAIVFLFTLQAGLVSLKLRLFVIKEILVNSESLTLLRDEGVTTAGVFNGFLPLEVKLVAFLMKTLELFGCLVKLNLGGLSLSDLLLEFTALAAYFNSQFLNLEGKLLDFSLISTSVLLEGEIVLLFLAGGEGPLFQLFLVPVHFKFELVHFLVGLEDHVLDVVEAVLLVGNALL